MTSAYHAAILAAATFSMFRVDSSHSGVFAASTASNYAGLHWRTKTSGAVHATPTVFGTMVYVGSNDGFLYAIDRRTGDIQWRFRAKGPVDSTAAAQENDVYFQDRTGTVYDINAHGRARWQSASGPALPLEFAHDNYSTWSSSPALSEGILVIGEPDGSVRGLRASSGTLLWRLKTGGQIESTPAIANGTAYVGSFDGKMYAVDLRTGRTRWTFVTKASTQVSSTCHFDCHSIRSSPAVSNGLVIFGARDGFLYAVDARTGAERWNVDHQTAWVNASPAVEDGTVYDADSSNQRIEAVDLNSGHVRWQYKADSLVFSSPAIVGTALYASDFAGNIIALNRSDGALLWKRRGTADAIISSPVVANDKLYVGSDDGCVYALNLTAGAALKRAVFFDAQHPKVTSYSQAVSGVGPDQLRDFLASRGYDLLDEDSLAAFMTARIADHSTSVVVFATDYLPDVVAPSANEAGLFRRYLDAGGKVVWSGFPPLLFRRDPNTGAPTALNLAGLQTLLGVSYAALSEPINAKITRDGSRWGLHGSQITRADVDPHMVTSILALDDRGMAGAWLKNYGGPSGSGFVALPPLGFDGLPDTGANLTFADIQFAAEYFPN